ncbi:Nucleotide-binding oligomerization domain-containing protein 2 [Hondaea fermentalgiana]|uniref:Nucleotide-binding oligomerization domain-containing protein 2 n=1 Tax=Hondaea fermentalgiana TaxID=2315210 RepID=A0A2R5GHY9_9STRA|nr:Nucleotide-binding oligomerization domain-containing protein 2 [Hondaea fermentalgiana]|eukprot:GBG28273.1 Nucleotide-binding oligomerization domain-containing protein 2 [Hondaea fermentalgiana]
MRALEDLKLDSTALAETESGASDTSGLYVLTTQLTQSAPTSRLRKLNLANNNIDCEGAKMVSRVIHSLRTLEVVELEGNNISASGAKALAKSLVKSQTLQQLDISRNNVRDRGAAQFAKALAVGVSIHTLRLADNFIFDEGACKLADALCKGKTDLRVLDLANNQTGLQTKRAFTDLIASQCCAVADLRLGPSSAPSVADSPPKDEDVNSAAFEEWTLDRILDELEKRATLQRQLASAQEKFSRAQQHLTQTQVFWEAHGKHDEAAASPSEEKLAKAKELLRILEHENETLQSQIASAEAATAAMKNEASSLLRRQREAEIERQGLESAVQSANLQVEAHARRKRVLEAELDVKTREHEASMELVLRMNKQVASVEKEVRDLEQVSRTAEQREAALKLETDVLKGEVTSIQESTASLRAKLEVLEAEHEQCQKSVATVQAKCSEQAASVKDFEFKRTNAQRDLNDANSIHEALLQDVAQASKAYDRLCAQREDLRTEYDKLLARKQSVTEERDALLEKHSELCHRNDSLQAQVNAVREKHDAEMTIILADAREREKYMRLQDQEKADDSMDEESVSPGGSASDPEFVQDEPCMPTSLAPASSTPCDTDAQHIAPHLPMWSDSHTEARVNTFEETPADSEEVQGNANGEMQGIYDDGNEVQSNFSDDDDGDNGHSDDDDEEAAVQSVYDERIQINYEKEEIQSSTVDKTQYEDHINKMSSTSNSKPLDDTPSEVDSLSPSPTPQLPARPPRLDTLRRASGSDDAAARRASLKVGASVLKRGSRWSMKRGFFFWVSEDDKKLCFTRGNRKSAHAESIPLWTFERIYSLVDARSSWQGTLRLLGSKGDTDAARSIRLDNVDRRDSIELQFANEITARTWCQTLNEMLDQLNTERRARLEEARMSQAEAENELHVEANSLSTEQHLDRMVSVDASVARESMYDIATTQRAFDESEEAESNSEVNTGLSLDLENPSLCPPHVLENLRDDITDILDEASEAAETITFRAVRERTRSRWPAADFESVAWRAWFRETITQILEEDEEDEDLDDDEEDEDDEMEEGDKREGEVEEEEEEEKEKEKGSPHPSRDEKAGVQDLNRKETLAADIYNFESNDIEL